MLRWLNSLPELQWITFGDYAEAMSKIKEAGIPIMVMVQSVEEAVKAAGLGASAIVAQVMQSAPCPVIPELLSPCPEHVSTLPAVPPSEILLAMYRVALPLACASAS